MSRLMERIRRRLAHEGLRLRTSLVETWVRYRPLGNGGRPHGLPGRELIVSLTSYPPRYATLVLTLKCLLAQRTKPDRVVLWIARDDASSLPAAVQKLTSRGLEIRECVDLKVYNKIIPSLIAFPDAFIVTADDDVIYGPDWLGKLIDAYLAGPPAVIAHRAREIRFEPDGRIASYETWPLSSEGSRWSGRLMPTGVGGVLYPPGSLPSETRDADAFRRTTPTNDDLWLFWMAQKAGYVCRLVADVKEIRNWERSQNVSLYSINGGDRGKNDAQIAALWKEYGAPPLI